MTTIQGRIQRQQDELDLFRTLTDTETELKQRQMDVSADTDYATQSQRFQKSAKEVMFRKLGTLRSPSVAAVYQSRAERMIAEAGIHVEIDANKRQIAQQGAETLTLGEQAATRWIEASPEQRDNIKQEWFDLVDRSLAFGPEQKNKKKAQWDEWTALESIRVSPTAALAALSMGAFPELDPKQRETMMRSAEIAEARQERLTLSEVKAEQEKVRQGFVEKWANDTLTTPEILSSNLPATGEGSKEHYLKLMAAKEKEPFVEDRRLKATLLQRVRTNKIVSNEQLEQAYIDSAKKGHGIDWQSMMDLRKELTEMQTPDGRILGRRKQEMFDGVKASVDKSIIGLKSDPEGALLFLQYQEWADAQLAAYRQQGKNPHDLLDPSNPQYLARPSAIAPFQRSLQDTMKDMAERFKRPDRQPLTPQQQRQPSETIEQYLKRVK